MRETYIKNMEFLISELHKEWNKSKGDSNQIKVSLNKAHKLRSKISEHIVKQQKTINEDTNIDFEESMKMSKENFVMLRLIKKINRNMKKGEEEFCVNLDTEEYNVYLKLLESKGGA